MADGSIVIDVELKDEQFNKSLDKIQDHGTKTAKAVGDAMEKVDPPKTTKFAQAFDKIETAGKKAFSAITNVAKNIAVGVMGAAAALTAYTVASIKGAEADEAQNRQLKQVAKSMGLFGDESDTVADRLAKLADKQELLLGVDAEIIKATQTKLLTFKELAESADELGGAFDRATMLAIDLAAAGFGDATSNAVQLGKALNDPIKGITALNKSGINFTDIEKEKIKTLVESNQMLEAQEVILRAIETQVGGTALASVKASDQIMLMAAAVGDAFGAAFLPVIRDLMPAIGQFVTGLTPLMENLGQAIADMIAQVGSEEEVMAAAQALGDYLGNALEAAAPMIAAALNAMLIAVSSIIAGMSEGIVAVAVAVIGALASNMASIITPLVGAMLTLLEELSNRSEEWLTPMVQAALDIIEMLVLELTKPENIEMIVNAGLTLGAAILAGIFKAIDDGWGAGLRARLPFLNGPTPSTLGAPFGAGSVPGRVSASRPLAIAGLSAGSTSTSTTINFNQPVQSYSETVRAFRDMERQLVF